MTRVAITLLVLAGCGRIGFDETEGVARCPASPAPSGWTVAPGYRAVVMTDALAAPTAVTVAGGAFGDEIYVANGGDATVRAIDPRTGAWTMFVATDAWPIAPTALTAMIWDAGDVFDGGLYLADRGTSSDDDSTIFAIDASGAARVATAAPGPALDDVFSLAFVDKPGYGTGLFVAGDTDGGGAVDWARYDADGAGAPFSTIAGVSGLAVDTTGDFGGVVFAARPQNLSFAGDDAIAKVSQTGEIIITLADSLDDVHAAVFAPGGELGGWLYAATQRQIVRVDPSGLVETIVDGADFDTLDGNVLAFPTDGDAMYAVSRAGNALMCLEPTGEPPGSLPDPPPPGGSGVGE